MEKAARLKQSEEMKKQHYKNRCHNVAIALGFIGKVWHDYRNSNLTPKKTMKK